MDKAKALDLITLTVDNIANLYIIYTYLMNVINLKDGLDGNILPIYQSFLVARDQLTNGT